VSKCWKQEKSSWNERWLCSAKVSSVWVHRTVSDAPGWLRRTCYSREVINGVRLKFTRLSGVHRTVRWAHGRPGQRTAARSARDTWPSQRSEGAPDCLVCTGQCPVRQRLQSANGRLRQRRKEIRAGQCPVRQATEGKNCLPGMLSTAPSCLGAIKGTPRHMEENTKHSLSIPKHQDFDSAHLILCDSN
jgi:hypothetical protein